MASATERLRTDAIVAYLASRHVGNSYWCWGAGSDNGLCSAPVDGADGAFVEAVLNWVRAQLVPTIPAYLFGYSGGARMAWRLACDAGIAPLFDGMAIASGLLAADLRQPPPAGCALGTLPRLIVLHGDEDATTAVSNADASVDWVADAAGCAVDATRDTSVDGELADVRDLSSCAAAPPPFALTYYRILGGRHSAPTAAWVDEIFYRNVRAARARAAAAALIASTTLITPAVWSTRGAAARRAPIARARPAAPGRAVAPFAAAAAVAPALRPGCGAGGGRRRRRRRPRRRRRRHRRRRRRRRRRRPAVPLHRVPPPAAAAAAPHAGCGGAPAGSRCRRRRHRAAAAALGAAVCRTRHRGHRRNRRRRRRWLGLHRVHLLVL